MFNQMLLEAIENVIAFLLTGKAVKHGEMVNLKINQESSLKFVQIISQRCQIYGKKT